MARQEKKTIDETHEYYGRIAEELEMACYRYQGKYYEDVTENKEEQKKDIDLLVKCLQDIYGVEVKGDYVAWCTANLTYEEFTHLLLYFSKKLSSIKKDEQGKIKKNFTINEVRSIIGIEPNGCNNKCTAKYMVYYILREEKIRTIKDGKEEWVGTKRFKLATAKGSNNVRIVYNNEDLKKHINELSNTSLPNDCFKVVRQAGDGFDKSSYNNVIYTIPSDNLDRLDENNNKVYTKEMLDKLNEKQITSLSKDIVEIWDKNHQFFQNLKILFDEYHTKEEFIRILYEVYPQ